MHITIPSSTNDDRNPHWYLLYTYRSAVLVVLVLHIYGEWLQTQSLLISFFHLDSFLSFPHQPHYCCRRRSNDVHIDPKLPWVFHSGERKLYILRGHYLPRSISARADPIPTECTTTLHAQEDNKKRGDTWQQQCNDDVIRFVLQLTAFTIHIMIINQIARSNT